MNGRLPASERLIEVCLAAAQELGPGTENPGGLSETYREILRQTADRFGHHLGLPAARDPALPERVTRALVRARGYGGDSLDDLERLTKKPEPWCDFDDLVTPSCLADLLEAMLADSASGRNLRGGLGAFYTPGREVDLLCRLLLLAQLLPRLEGLPDAGQTLARLLLPQGDRKWRNIDDALRTAGGAELCHRLLEELPNITWCDPACGGGNFLAAAVELVRNLTHELEDFALEDSARQRRGGTERKRRLPGWDRPRLPFVAGLDRMVEAAAVARLRLESFEERWGRPPSIQVGDALDLLVRAPGSEPASSLGAPGGFDIVLGNPPYVRHERLAGGGGAAKADLVAALRRCFPGIDAHTFGQSDLYAWFFPLAALLLRPGGHLGYIVSDSWLDSKSGEALRGFLATALHARLIIQDPARKSFVRAGVSTVAAIAVKPPLDETTCGDGVHFLAWDGSSRDGGSSEEMLAALAPEQDLVPPRAVPYTLRWGPYLRVSPAVAELLGTGRMVPLGRRAKLVYGSKPGIREFFILTSSQGKQEGIEPRFLRPIVTSAHDIATGAVEPKRLSRVAFVCSQALSDLEVEPNAAGALAWIRHGETQVTRAGARHTKPGVPWPQARSVRSRPGGWYRFVPRAGLDFLVPCLLGSRFLLPANPQHIAATNQFFHGGFLRRQDLALGLALLQSTVTWRLVEWFGRRKGLGGLNLYGYDLDQLPFPDPHSFSPETVEPIVAAHAILLCRPTLPATVEVGHGRPAEAPPDRVQLDEAVLSALGLPPAFLARLYRDFAEAVEMRVRKGRGGE